MRFFFLILLFCVFCSVLYPAEGISNIRTSYSKGKQRVVIDMDGNDEPAYYVRKNKGTIDITIEKITTTQKAESYAALLDNTNFIKKATLIILPQEMETLISLSVNEKTSDDIFALANSSRLVIDLEKRKPIKGDK